MRHTAIMCLLVILALATTATAGAVFVPDRGGLPAAILDRDGYDCLLGSFDFDGFQGYYSDFWDGGQIYAYLADAPAQGCACQMGVQVLNVHMILYVNQYVDLFARARIYAAVPDSAGCLRPGDLLAFSSFYEFTGYPGTGYANLEIPIAAPCIETTTPFFVAVEFDPSSLGAFVGVPVDDTPTACAGYVYQDGYGWVDPVTDLQWVGDFYVYGEAACCNDPVADETTSWGALKSLYR